MAEHELTGFLLSRSELGEQYLESLKHAQFKHSNQIENVNEALDPEVDLSLDYNINNGMQFLEYPTTDERLDKLHESFTSRKRSSQSFHKASDNIKANKKKQQSDNLKISYKQYQDYLNDYKPKNELNFTIPKPFEFSKRDYTCKKKEKIEEILEERKRIEDEILGYRFKPNDLKREMFISQYENIIEAEIEKRKYRTEKIKEKIVQEMKPFSFYQNDEKKFKERQLLVSQPPTFLPFKANPVPWTSQVTLYDDLIKKNEVERLLRVEERARNTFVNAKLPPRMEMHENKKKQQEQEMKLLDNTNSKSRSKSFKVFIY